MLFPQNIRARFMVDTELTCHKMQHNSNHDNDNLERVYVVFRVFNLGNDNIGLRVLVDPESMRLQDELSFNAESWSVVAAE